MTGGRLVVFDVDGTLVDSQAQILAAMAAAFAELGRPPPPRAAALAVVGLSLPLALARLAPPGLAAGGLERMAAAYRRAFAAERAAGAAPLYPGAVAALDALAARPGLQLGIATGKSRRGLRHLLDEHGLGGRFATLHCADDHPSKPDPAMLNAALAATGVAAGRALMVGDTTFDIAMGRAAGVHTLGVTWGYHPAAELAAAGAGALVAGFAALPPAVDRLLAAP